MIKIKPALSLTDFKSISKLADIIWLEHYISIISLEQIEYMLIKYNSVQALEDQVNQGFLFFCITYNNIPVGYLGVKKEIDFLFLSKLYVLNDYRGKKIGKAAMQYVTELTNSFQLKKVILHVNKFNTSSILAYKKMGFIKTKEIVTDIGNGFIMDDYEMVKAIEN
ncbi:GNAT family N-acetyltransferase [Mariniflexile litorale]|uniref:GNAT family N-acetyltransferase n=1 Tax=Mariniflexile litorale TaxID=3045158 RepID=A0AAU7EFD5_9FLAO|nr:GNAT family N-acetyltransferase [Mariniflexile sp. KMM 9835]MDQ8211583.1 GNAT family N-acetyltransferase [Mariniflexile sp. KMM 9835]